MALLPYAIKETLGVEDGSSGARYMQVEHAEMITGFFKAVKGEAIHAMAVPESQRLENPIWLEDVIITPELYRRTPRAPDHGSELAAWKHLSQFLSDEQSVVFEQLAKVLIEACVADSAGVTLQERRDSSGDLQRVSVAAQGVAKPLPRVAASSPCGTIIERQRAELFARPDLFYSSLDHDILTFQELLVVPWQLGCGRRGAVWVASHSAGRQFDSEDLRLIESLARFASVGMQRSQVDQNRRSHEAYASATRMANELAHEINNPLQALINSLHLVSPADGDEHLLQARRQAMRLARLVQGVLNVNRLDEPGLRKVLEAHP